MDTRKRISLILICLLATLPLSAARRQGIEYRKLAERPRAFYLHDFLTEQECDHLIELGRPHLERSYVVGSDGISIRVDPGRTSESAFLPPYLSDRIVRKIEARIATYLGFDLERAEYMQIARYLRGQLYQPHYDTFDLETPEGQSHADNGGQRVATFLMYLNTPGSGGATDFPYAGLSVKPKKGDALLFYPCLNKNQPDPMALHAGRPVLDGEKWIATLWFREGPYR